MRRRFRTVTLVVLGVLAVLGGAFVWTLPEIVRRVALDQIPRRTGRAAAIEDVDLNLFTGRLALRNLRLAERDGGPAFVELGRLEARLALTALFRSEIRLTEVAIVAPSVRIVRTGPAEFNFSDLMRPSAEAPPARAAGGWTLTLDRLALSGGRLRIHDRLVEPAADWLVQDVAVDAAGITTRAGARPGRLAVHARIDEAVLDVKADPVRLEPPQLGATLALIGFETRRLNPYVFAPLGLPYSPRGGRLTVTLDARVDGDARELTKAALSGAVSLEGEALTRAGRPEPFLGFSRLAVQLKEVDALSRSLTVASVALEGLEVTARRDAAGAIDLLEMLAPKRAAAAPAPAVTPTAAPTSTAEPGERKLVPVLRALTRGFAQIRVERIELAPATARFVDEGVKPTTTLVLTKLQANLDGVTWPVRGPATLAFSTALPGGGTLSVKGPIVLQPLDADLAFAVRDAPVTPYQAYIPVPAQLSGRFGGNSRNRIALKDGRMVLASKGDSWAQDVEIRAPGSDRPVMRVERMELTGIDFDWPRRAAVARATFRRPAIEVERERDGSINVRRLFTPPGSEEAKVDVGPRPAASPRPASAAKKPAGLLETMQLEFKDVRVEQGFVRFLDRTTTPAFSQDLSRLEMTVTGVSNRAGQRARLALQSVVGGDAALDIRGEIGAVGAPPFVDLVGELRSFKLASVDPYAEAAIGWVIKKGELQYKVRFKLDGDALDASNEVVVGQLQVAPSSGGDEVKQRIGLPLNLIVGLLKDSHGDIRANVPVTGSVGDPKFDLRETIWTAIKNVLVNIVKAPFRAIGRLFSRGETIEEPRIDPVTFAAGSSVLAPDMEEHLLRVADFLRRTPFVNVTLAPHASAADVEALRAEAVAARLREVQKARGLKGLPAAVAADLKARFPDLTPPATVEEQLALLRAREPVPETSLSDLARRRLEATRERLVTVEGIPAERLTAPEGPAGAGATPEPVVPGRVELAVVPRAE